MESNGPPRFSPREALALFTPDGPFNIFHKGFYVYLEGPDNSPCYPPVAVDHHTGQSWDSDTVEGSWVKRGGRHFKYHDLHVASYYWNVHNNWDVAKRFAIRSGVSRAGTWWAPLGTRRLETEADRARNADINRRTRWWSEVLGGDEQLAKRQATWERYRLMVRLRDSGLTLKAIGALFNVSHSRVQQVLNHELRKSRHPQYTRPTSPIEYAFRKADREELAELASSRQVSELLELMAGRAS